jgi:hypothetical protein
VGHARRRGEVARRACVRLGIVTDRHLGVLIALSSHWCTHAYTDTWLDLPGWWSAQGLGSYAQSKTYDIQIFALAVLLSSLFIYNSMGSIDETALDRLSYARREQEYD